MAYQRCTRCIMDNASDMTIQFDENGYCNYCSDILKRMPSEYFPNADGKEKLRQIIHKMKKDCQKDKFDCVVGISGGIDSSFILYMGYRVGLRMLAVHVDDGLDNPVAVENIKKLVSKTGVELVSIKPDHEEYADILYSLLKASVPNLAVAQDNLIIKTIQEYIEKEHIKYSLDGNNFAHEGILERGNGVNFCDKKYIESIQKEFGNVPLKKTKFISLTERYIGRHLKTNHIHLRPLNYIDYNMEKAIKTLNEFCGFQYYGGKHYESILTRFMQCYYLPEKFGIDKRKSHYSSLIMSNQMTREEALVRLEMPLYPNEELLEQDKKFLADYMGITVDEMERCIKLPPKKEKEYSHSKLNYVAPIARKLRHWIE